MKTIALLRHGFARDVNDRLSGFGEIEATEDGRVLITASISSAQLTGDCAATFDPSFALIVAMALIDAANHATRQAAHRVGEALVTAGLATQEAIVEQDRALAEIADLKRLLAEQVEARIADASAAESEG